MGSINKPGESKFWIAKDSDDHVCHGITDALSVTDSYYDLVTYTNYWEWRAALDGYSQDVTTLASDWDPSIPTYPTDALVMQWTIPSGAAGVSKNWGYGSSAYSDRTFTIDWGDGNKSEYSNTTVYNLTHTYASAGTYTVQIYSEGGSGIKLMRFGSPSNVSYRGTSSHVTGIIQWGNHFSRDTFQKMFFDCDNIGTISATDKPNLSSTRYLTSMFENSGNNVRVDSSMENWDTSNVQDMRYMFKYTKIFNNDAGSGFNIGNWNITGLTSSKGATNMFYSNNANSVHWSITTARYDELLIGWGAQSGSVNSGVNLGAGETKYTGGGSAASGRAALVAAGWTITDGGTV
mgnify:CR=1 FL=1